MGSFTQTQKNKIDRENWIKRKKYLGGKTLFSENELIDFQVGEIFELVYQILK